MDYPGLAGRTGHFGFGAPRSVTVGADGARVVFLRSLGPEDPDAALWVLDVATAAETMVDRGPLGAYAIDRDARVAAFARDGRLFRADLIDASVAEVATDEPAEDPRPDPAGHNIGYIGRASGAPSLRVVGPDGDRLLAGEPGNAWREHGSTIAWGVADVAARRLGRDRGWWWSPDGVRVLAVRTAGSTSSLHLLDLDLGWVDVHWDRETYPLVVDVRWGDGGGPLITVLRRLQQHGLVLAIDPRTGETQVHAELADARWVEPVAGTPRHLPDGRVLVGGELAHDGFDARCLFADGSLLTPPNLYVRRVVGTMQHGSRPGSPDLVVEGTDGDPASQFVFRVRTALGSGGAEAHKITASPGWHRAETGGDVLVVDDVVWRGRKRVATLRSLAATPPYAPKPVLEKATDRELPAGVLYPTSFVAGTRIPVLVTLADEPGRQQVLADAAAWQERQWWADSGFAVVSIDSRGTPGVAPSFEKVVHRRLVDVLLGDQVDALLALVGKHPDLDLSSVSVRGSGLGGWLAAMAVLRRPDVFHRAVARSPVLDWGDLPAPYAERYLGDPRDSPEVYAQHSLFEAAEQSDHSRELLIVGAHLPGYQSVPTATLDEELAYLRSSSMPQR